jgi:hypothetical protein
MDGCEQRAKQQHQEGDLHIRTFRAAWLQPIYRCNAKPVPRDSDGISHV